METLNINKRRKIVHVTSKTELGVVISKNNSTV